MSVNEGQTPGRTWGAESMEAIQEEGKEAGEGEEYRARGKSQGEDKRKEDKAKTEKQSTEAGRTDSGSPKAEENDEEMKKRKEKELMSVLKLQGEQGRKSERQVRAMKTTTGLSSTPIVRRTLPRDMNNIATITEPRSPRKDRKRPHTLDSPSKPKRGPDNPRTIKNIMDNKSRNNSHKEEPPARSPRKRSRKGSSSFASGDSNSSLGGSGSRSPLSPRSSDRGKGGETETAKDRSPNGYQSTDKPVSKAKEKDDKNTSSKTNKADAHPIGLDTKPSEFPLPESALPNDLDPSTMLINFQKLSKLTEILMKLNHVRKVPYHFKTEKNYRLQSQWVREWILSPDKIVLSESDRFGFSKLCEPPASTS